MTKQAIGTTESAQTPVTVVESELVEGPADGATVKGNVSAQMVRKMVVDQAVVGEQHVRVRRTTKAVRDKQTLKQQRWDASAHERWPSETSASEELSVDEIE